MYHIGHAERIQSSSEMVFSLVNVHSFLYNQHFRTQSRVFEDRLESTVVFRSSFNIMARRTSDAGVEECKGYSPPSDHTTNASSTPLPLGSWNLNTSTWPTESERSARVAKKRAKYAQRTKQERQHDAHQKRMPGVSWQQRLGGASSATGEYGLLHRDLKTRFCL